jgi:hypothetical protein
MNRDNPVTIAVRQRLPIRLDQFGGGCACGRHLGPVVNVIGDVVDPVPQVHAVDQHVQRHLTDVPPRALIGPQAR